ncbi:hypothetical protein NIES2109_02110 [Nostoc sp. HK-01]|nr:hypothetical protein NIES2109_02110 [Nostoc sp. HK-01]
MLDDVSPINDGEQEFLCLTQRRKELEKVCLFSRQLFLRVNYLQTPACI